VFVTSALNEPLEHRVFCHRAGDGQKLWESETRRDTGDLVYAERLPGVSTWASPIVTPDGRRLPTDHRFSREFR